MGLSLFRLIRDAGIHIKIVIEVPAVLTGIKSLPYILCSHTGSAYSGPPRCLLYAFPVIGCRKLPFAFLFLKGRCCPCLKDSQAWQSDLMPLLTWLMSLCMRLTFIYRSSVSSSFLDLPTSFIFLAFLCICVKNHVMDAFLPVFESCVGLPVRARRFAL
jgi:hypothetical protein